MIRTKIEHRQVAQAEQHEEDDEQNTVKRNQPVHLRGDQIKDMPTPLKHGNSRNKQHEVLEESLPVGQHNRITKTSTIGNRIGYGQPQCQRCHKRHHQQSQQRSYPPTNTEEQINAKNKLKQGTEHSCQIRHISCAQALQPPCFQVILYLIDRAQRVIGLNKSGEQKNDSQ